MFNSLSKIGLSDTKHFIKQYYSGCSEYSSGGSSFKGKKSKAPSANITNFDITDHIPKPSPIPGDSALNLLIELLSQKEREVCALQGHDHNSFRFVCL